MKFKKPILVAMVSVVFACTAVAQNKTGADGNPIPLDAADEPHHSVLFENEYVRVLSFDLGPQKTTSLHAHRDDFVRVALTDADLQISQDANAYSHPQTNISGGVTPELRGVARFLYGKRQLMAHNPETVISYRSVEIEIKKISQQTYNCSPYDANCLLDFSVVPLALERDKTYAETLDRDTVRVTEVQVLPKEEWKSHLRSYPYLVVAVSDVDLIDTSNTDEALEFQAPSGGVQWAPKSFMGSLKNVSDKAARFVIVELK